MLTIFGEYYQNGMKRNHLTIEDLPYKPLYFSPCSKRLEPASKYSDLIGTISRSIAYISVIIFQIELRFQTGKYVVCAEDLPRANKLPCAQRPIKRAKFEEYCCQVNGTYKKVPLHMRRCCEGGFSRRVKKYLPRAENKLSSRAEICQL